MSKVEIEIPDGRWFRGEWQFKPQDKQLCMVIHKHGISYPNIYQWREEFNSFVDVYEKFLMDEYEENGYWNPSFAQMNNISFWKPLGLPEDVNERVLTEIKKWFEDGE